MTRPASSPSPATPEARSGRPSPTVQATGGSVWYPVFFSPPLFVDGGRGLITYGGKRGLTWRAVETGAEVRTLDFPELARGDRRDRTQPRRAVSRRPRLSIARASDSSRSPRAIPSGPSWSTRTPCSVRPSAPTAGCSLTGSTDNTVRLWAVPGGEPLARPLDLHRPVKLVAFAPDGRSLATQDGDLVRLWALPEEGVPMVRVPLDGERLVRRAQPRRRAHDPDRDELQSARALRSTRASRVATGRPAGPPLRPGGLIVDAAFSPDGRSVATLGARDGPSTEGQEVVVWDWASGRQGWRAALPSEPRSLSYRPDGRRLAVLCGGGELLVFDPDAGREVLRWQRPRRRACSPLGQQRQGRLQPRRPERADLGDGE